MTIPSTQKVVLFRENGGLDVLRYEEDFPVPTISASQVLIKNQYAGVNFIEAYFRSGLYPSEKPYVLGREAVGVIAAVGKDVTNLKQGDRVAYLGGSSFAQYTAAEASGKIFKLDADIDEETAQVYAGLLINGLTTLTFINESYKVQKGDYILVHAAAGGCGLLFAQQILAKGAHVIATASSPEKLQLAKEAGAEFLINSSTEDIVARVKEITHNKGVEAVYDGIGKDTFEISLEVVARKGTLVSFGNASGAVPPFLISRLLAKNVKVLRPSLFNYLADQEEWDFYSQELLRLVKEGILKQKITKVYPLAEYRQAAEDLEGRKTTGKLVLEIPQ
ncbi:hypothetical protein BABINDRAFT_167299 [Babjeviella inositovora NRRL Y-12698]|uniref:Probable quinone oxidoreductase n=1 Tax=Babjeviella inositovora NRRL Y-12698 TaxID=984486 RepID=A0A1E3QP61_9ASCO|nr:uncharacterized protein BABINDRAFT_167299 [Babjeviella inositovora NRRL Y-12698]ODQ79440.1 hypothetical protein BABINDRAFT_167299 [Babjeviella inositovora NRRL Y-12698]